MHSKAFHRILGLMVLFAMVLLMLPFWDGQDELSINERVVHPPAFPDQSLHKSTQVAPVKSKPVSASPAEVSLFDNNLEKVFAQDLQEIKASIVKPEKPKANLSAVKTNLVKTEKSSKTAFIKPKTKPETKPAAMLTWSVQIEGFQKKSDAVRFVNRLRQQGHRAYLQTVVYAQSSQVQVWIESIPDYRQAENLAKRLHQGYQLKAYVMRQDAWRS